ncbi:unnamed protein product, partial [Prorocentrum cordatum]
VSQVLTGALAKHVALMDPQTAADTALQEWGSIWQHEVDWEAPGFKVPAEHKPTLPPSLGHHVLHACKAFSPKTGLGESNIRPRLWAPGPAAGLASLAGILSGIERGSVHHVLAAAQAQGRHAKRGASSRVGTSAKKKIRRPEVQRWQRREPRAYDWAVKGRSAERAAWMQGLMAEESLAQGEAIAATYYDLRKRYETVLHSLTWKGGIPWRFPKPLLGFILRTFSRMRRAVRNGCYTEGGAQGIVAGSVFGALCLSLVLIGAIDDLYVAKPRADTCLYFDDLAASPRGGGAGVVAIHGKLTDEITHAFEPLLKLQASRGTDGKTAVAASHGSAERQLGAPDTPITRLRQAVAAASPGCSKGRSAALALLAEGADPAVLAPARPLVERGHGGARGGGHGDARPPGGGLALVGIRGALVAVVARLGGGTRSPASVTYGTEVHDLSRIDLQLSVFPRP